MAINTDTTITACIDWISITINDRSQYPVHWTRQYIPDKSGLLGYDTSITYVDGRRELISSTRPDMKTHVIMSGDTLRIMAGMYKCSSVDILRSIPGKISRLDIAIDVKNGSLDIAGIHKQFCDGNCTTNTNVGLFYEGIGDGAGKTLYIGSSKAAKRLRIYDKARERKLPSGSEWTRIELQLRGDAAMSASGIIRSAIDDNDIITKISGIINAFFRANTLDWDIVMGSDTIKLSDMSDDNANRRMWILTTVASSIANEIIANNGDMGIISELYTEIVAQITEKTEHRKRSIKCHN